MAFSSRYRPPLLRLAWGACAGAGVAIGVANAGCSGASAQLLTGPVDAATGDGAPGSPDSPAGLDSSAPKVDAQAPGDERDAHAGTDSSERPPNGGSDGSSGLTPDGAADAPSTACDYPAGPYGLDVGDPIDPSLHWDGFAPGSSSASTIRVDSFFDCDGKKGYNAMLVIAAAQGIGACQEEAGDIPKWLAAAPAPLAANWSIDGVVVITLLTTDAFGARATVTTASQWIASFGLGATYVGADPAATLAVTQPTLPLNLLINPRTMRIVEKTQGPPTAGDSAEPAVDALALMNKH